jgi:hypothetical protein
VLYGGVDTEAGDKGACRNLVFYFTFYGGIVFDLCGLGALGVGIGKGNLPPARESRAEIHHLHTCERAI